MSYASVVTRGLLLAFLLACSTRDLPVSGVPHIDADVSGHSGDACVLTVANGLRAEVYDVAAPLGLVDVPAPAVRESLGQCSEATSVGVGVVPRGDAAPLQVVRGGACLSTFGAREDFFDALDYDSEHCPASASVTLVCGGETLYDAVPLALCAVGM